jgi:hypothetical protein
MRLKQSEEARSLWQTRKQRPEVTRQPTTEGAITDAFDGKDESQRNDLARMQRGLTVFGRLFHLVIYTTKEFSDKVLGGHDGSLLLQLVWSPLH